jgi:plasmid stabilization system protein ParE
MKVEWAGPAILDVRAIKAYISKDSEAYANRFAERIIEAAESLQTLPLRGRTVPEANSESIRELLFGSYRIIYRVEPTRVLLMTVVHAARDLARMEPKPWEVL